MVLEFSVQFTVLYPLTSVGQIFIRHPVYVKNTFV